MPGNMSLFIPCRKRRTQEVLFHKDRRRGRTHRMTHRAATTGLFINLFSLFVLFVDRPFLYYIYFLLLLKCQQKLVRKVPGHLAEISSWQSALPHPPLATGIHWTSDCLQFLSLPQRNTGGPHMMVFV